MCTVVMYLCLHIFILTHVCIHAYMYFCTTEVKHDDGNDDIEEEEVEDSDEEEEEGEEDDDDQVLDVSSGMDRDDSSNSGEGGSGGGQLGTKRPDEQSDEEDYVNRSKKTDPSGTPTITKIRALLSLIRA